MDHAFAAPASSQCAAPSDRPPCSPTSISHSIAASQFGTSRSVFGNLMMYCAASRSVTNGFPARHHDRIGKALIPRHQSYPAARTGPARDANHVRDYDLLLGPWINAACLAAWSLWLPRRPTTSTANRAEPRLAPDHVPIHERRYDACPLGRGISWKPRGCRWWLIEYAK